MPPNPFTAEKERRRMKAGMPQNPFTAEKERRAAQQAPEGPMQAAIGQPSGPPPNRLGSDALGRTVSDISESVSNIPSSAAQYGADAAAIIHSPVQMLTGIKDIAMGIAQKFTPGEQDQEKSADAIGTMLVDRWGSIENIRNTLKTDPVGFLGDVAGILTGGAGLAVKGAAMAGRVGRVSALAGEAGNVAAKVAKVGRSIDPLAIAGEGLKVAGRTGIPAKVGGGLAQLLGVYSGGSATNIKVGYKGAYAGGDQNELFLKSMRGDIPMDAVVEEARTAVSAMHAQKMDEYKTNIAGVFNDAPDTPMDFKAIVATTEEAMGTGKFKGVDISKSTGDVRSRIQDTIEQWSELDPAEYHNVEGMDALRKSIGDIRKSTEHGTPARSMADKIYFAFRKAVDAQAPGYGEVLTNYHQASNHLEDLERALSLGNKAGTETALRKLQAIGRNDVTSAYGKRAEYGKELADAGATGLESMIAGQSLSSWAPRGVRSYILGAGATGYGAGVSPALIPLAMALSSPRVVGMLTHGAGRTHRGLAEVLSRAPGGPGMASFQAGRAGREAQR